MSVRQSALIGELEQQRALLGTRAATFAAENAELREALNAAHAEIGGLRAADAERADLLPKAIEVATKEGGDWRPFATFPNHVAKVHAIRFDNGRIWDAVNGWRPGQKPDADPA